MARRKLDNLNCQYIRYQINLYFIRSLLFVVKTQGYKRMSELGEIHSRLVVPNYE